MPISTRKSRKIEYLSCSNVKKLKHPNGKPQASVKGLRGKSGNPISQKSLREMGFLSSQSVKNTARLTERALRLQMRN